jgi:hypothetical protein
MFNAVGAVILLTSARGNTAYNCVGALMHKFLVSLANFFATSAKTPSEASTPTCGGDAFDMSSLKVAGSAH